MRPDSFHNGVACQVVLFKFVFDLVDLVVQ